MFLYVFDRRTRALGPLPREVRRLRRPRLLRQPHCQVREVRRFADVLNHKRGLRAEPDYTHSGEGGHGAWVARSDRILCDDDLAGVPASAG